MRVAELHVTWDEFRDLVGTKGHEPHEERRMRYLRFARTCASPAACAELADMRDGSVHLVPHAAHPPERLTFRDLDDDAGESARKYWDAKRRGASGTSPLTADAATVR